MRSRHSKLFYVAFVPTTWLSISCGTEKTSRCFRAGMPPSRLQVLLGVVEALGMDQAIIFCR